MSLSRATSRQRDKAAVFGASSALALLFAFHGGVAAAQQPPVDTVAQTPADASAAPPTGGATEAEEPIPTTDDAQAGATEVEAIVVTGSRISRTGFTAPTPVTSVGTAELEARAPSTLADVLTQIPSFRPTNTPQTAGVTSRAGGLVTADLRGIGPVRTLTLVNGRRFVPSNAEGTVDLKQIPALLVSQVEVVTGGASAAWGSDAVAGVVNFILKDKIDGIEGTAQYGQSERGDNREFRGSLATGGEFAGDRLRWVAGVDYLKNEGIGTQYTRDWGRQEYGLITNPAFATNGLPNFIISPNVHTSNMTPGSLIVTGPLRGTAFGPGGVPFNFQFGQVFGGSMIGGDGFGSSVGLLSPLGVPIEAITSLASAAFDVSDDLTAFAELSTSWTKVLGNSQFARDQGNLVIQRDNAYLPAATRAAMVARGLQTITIGRHSEDIGPIMLERHNTVLRGVVGLRGDLPRGWEWDAYYQHGRNRYDVKFGPNNRIQANWLRAVDAVVGPGGSVVCRSILTSPTNGCIPVNVFGDGSLQLNSYVHGTADFLLVNEQRVAAINFQGDAFSTWAGPISLAFGAEHRNESLEGTSDPIAQQLNPNGSVGGWILGNQLPLSGEVSLWDVYAETVVPLAANAPLAQALDFNAAVRRTDYERTGPVTTWKLGLSYRPVDDLRFRLTRSRDIRAPNLTELFEDGGAGNTNVFDPVLNQQVQVREVARGNRNLTPEIADTLTGGLIYRPGWLRGFNVSIDYYDIEINDVIATLGAANITNGCFAGVTALCSSIVFNPDRTIAFVVNESLNLSSLKTSGIDLEVRYDLPLSNFSERLPGELQLRLLLTHVDDLTFVNQAGPQRRAGQVSDNNRVSGVPKWSGNGDATYKVGPWTLNLQGRYVGEGLFNLTYREGAGAALTINDNTVPAYIYYSFSAAYEFDAPEGRRLQVYGLVNNLFDTDPPFIPSGAGGSGRETSTNPVFYDVIGRGFKAGLRFRY